MQFSAFLQTGLLHDMLCLYNAERRQFHTLVTLGSNVCGHPKITHGGFTAAIIDETLGGLNYVLKREGVVPHGPSYTVHLEVRPLAAIPAFAVIGMRCRPQQHVLNLHSVQEADPTAS